MEDNSNSKKRKKQESDDEDYENDDDEVLSPVKGVSKPSWDEITDLNVLRKALVAKDKEIEQLKKKLAAQEKNIKKTVVDVASLSDTVRKSLKSQVSPQIHYKPSLKGGSAKFKAEVPNCPYEVIQSVFGDEKTKTTARSKQVKFDLSSDELSKVFGTDFSKGLRYGASLSITSKYVIFGCSDKAECTVTYAKEGQHLKLSGSYTMLK